MIDPIPDGWTKVEFDNFTTLQRGKDLTKVQFREGIVPVAGSNGIIGYHDTAIAKAPGITVGRSGSTGKVAVYEEDFWPHNTSLYVQDFHGNDPYFAGVLLDSLNLARFKTGASVPTLDRNSFKTLPLLVPPLPEQKKIAHILSTVQRAIEAQERIIQTITELKRALMHKLFTEGLRGEPQKQTEIGSVPESWEVVTLGMHIQITHGYAFKGKFFVSDGPTVLTPGNFRLDGGLYWGRRTKYTTESYEPNVVLHPGELVVVMTDLAPAANLLGGPAFIPNGRTILHNQRIGKVVMKSNKTSLQFLYWVFLSEAFKRYMRQTATGSTVRHTSPSKIYQYAFGLPTLDEHATAVDSLAKVDSKLANVEIKKLALQNLFRTLLHELMTAKIRVHDLTLTAG